MVVCMARGLEHDPVDNSIQEARTDWQAKVKPKRRGCLW
jgi:hypothetical protein